LFFKLFVRLTLAAGVFLAVCVLRPQTPLVWLVGVLLVWAAAMSLWTAWSLRRILGPLQASAGSLVEGQQAPLSTQYRDFDGLARALSSASEQVQSALGKAAESRRQLEALLDSMQDAVVAVDSAGRIQWSNQRMQRLIVKPGGYAGSSVRVGHALVQTIRDPEVLECVRLAMEEQTVQVRRSTTVLPGRIYEVNASPMPAGGAVAVLHDVTRMEEMEREQRDFVANVSHRLQGMWRRCWTMRRA
jgi:two-component system phosphate regulon sensor histidine kinase PhoR